MGVTNTSLTLTNVQVNQAGDYSVLVTNRSGSTPSSNRVLTVNVPFCVSPPAGLADWWPGDGAANNTAGTNHGILVASATANGPGVKGTGFHFDGTNDYVQIPDSPNFHLANFTVETWVRFDKMDIPSDGPTLGQQYMIFKQNSHATSFEDFVLIKDRTKSAGGDADSPVNGDIFLFMISSGTLTLEAEGFALVTNGVWYHVAAVRGPDYIQLYVNGKLDAQTNVLFPQDYGTFPLCFGSSGQSYGDCKLGGSLDEVSLYNRVLSSNEIAAIYQAGSLGKCKSPANVQAAVSPDLDPGMSFAGGVGQTYGVQASSNLADPNGWQGVTDLTLAAQTNLWYDPPPATQAQRFYRVVQGAVSIP